MATAPRPELALAPGAAHRVEDDVRALSFSVEPEPDGARQDYSLQSAPTLPLNDAAAFLAGMKVLTAASRVEIGQVEHSV